MLTSIINKPVNKKEARKNSIDLYYSPQLHKFTNIIILNCANNNLKYIPVLPRTLQYFYCENNQLITLPILPSGLIKLHCNKNKLTMLPYLPTTIETLICNDNQLLYLPELNLRTLNTLSCIRNPFIEYLRNGSRISAETINHTNKTVREFRYSYYLLKYKWKLLEIIIKIKMKPENIRQLLENKTLSLEMDKLDTFDIL